MAHHHPLIKYDRITQQQLYITLNILTRSVNYQIQPHNQTSLTQYNHALIATKLKETMRQSIPRFQ